MLVLLGLVRTCQNIGVIYVYVFSPVFSLLDRLPLFQLCFTWYFLVISDQLDYKL